MDAPMKKGTPVRQKVEVVRGTVIDIRFDADGPSFEYLVEWDNPEEADGKSERWFAAAQVEADPTAKKEAKA